MNMELSGKSFSELEPSYERYVLGIWQLHVLRFHLVRAQNTTKIIKKINTINQHLGVDTVNIDLQKCTPSYSESKPLLDALVESSLPKWLWFHNISVLEASNFAGWLRNKLTVRDIDNLRVVFIADSMAEIDCIFNDYKEPLYQSATTFDTSFDVYRSVSLD